MGKHSITFRALRRGDKQIAESNPMELKLTDAEFWLPPLADVAGVVETALRRNYREVEVGIAACPDLRALGCAFSGLGGAPFLIEIGGEPYAHNPKYRDLASFDLQAIATACGRPDARLLGAGFPSLEATRGRCGELMPCLELGGRSVSKIARVGKTKNCILEDYPSLLHGGLGNLYASDGAPGDVLAVTARERIGDEASFSQVLRGALSELPGVGGAAQVGMGGIFHISDGQVRAHVSPDYDCIPFKYYDEERDEVIRQDFLQFYEAMGPDLMCMSIFWSGDPTGGALHLRGSHEHTHFFSTAGRPEGGHYHHDITPETIAYRGYFQLAERIYRVNDIYAELRSLT